MKKLPRGVVLFIFFLLCLSMNMQRIHGQGLSTEGKDFWVGYLTNWLQNPNNPVILELYISADDTTSGTVTIPRQPAFTPINFTVYPNVTKRIVIPTNLAMASGTNKIENKGVHITTENNVSVYAMNKRQYSADMTVVLPTYSLGNDYFVLSHWEDGNRNNNANSDSEFMIVAITDSTEVEILPTFESKGGNPAGVPFRVTLQRGQTYQVRAVGDLTGTRITTTATAGCSSFAVFSGNMYTQVGECDVRNGHDHLYAQMYPTNTLGKNFIVVPLENRYNGDIIKFLATQDNTTITAGGQSIQLNAGEFLKILSDKVLNVQADKPIAIGQYSRTMDCDGTLGDPFLIPISPNEQMLKKITFNAPSIATLENYSLTIITKTADIYSITFDGTSVGNYFSPVAGTEYSYARINTIGGNHTIYSANGFIAYVYGFGHNESFGYATGASLANLNVDVVVEDQNGAAPIDSLCLGQDVVFTPVADTVFKVFEYDFGDGHRLTTYDNSPVFHRYNKTGKYLVSMKASIGTGDCSSGNEETTLKWIGITTPEASILGPRSVCPNTSNVLYKIEEPHIDSYQWFVNGGTIKTGANANINVDWHETNRNATVQLLATNRYGCVSDTIMHPVRINVQLDPEAPFGPDSLCSNNIIDVPYNAYYTNVSTYQWEVDFGSISSGNGTNEVTVNWDSQGKGKLWFQQISVTDTVCDGLSDTLNVLIRRNPSQIGQIVMEKDTILLGEEITLHLDIDTLYRFADWVLGDGTVLDTISARDTIRHTFLCGTKYTIRAIAYDTGTVCSDTKILLEKDIFVKAPEIEIINVTVSHDVENAIEVRWIMRNEAFYDKPVYLYRIQWTGNNTEADWKLITNLSTDQTYYLDEGVKIDEFPYLYKLVTNLDCEEQISSNPHLSVLLNATKEDNLTSLQWNSYEEWREGVDHYELWLSVDSSEYILYETSNDLQLSYTDSIQGFDHCFYVKAIEREGNNSWSASNTTCVEYIPQIHTYNIITPNADNYNEFFTIDNIEHYPHSKLTILNRWGKILYETIGYKNNWNGKINGKAAPAGTYYYILELNEPRNEIGSIKGFFSILY